MTLRADIKAAEQAIAGRFLDVVRNGQQTKALGNAGLYACGQYLDELGHAQRGVHGSAAALRVLGTFATSADEKDVVRGLVSYLEDRPDIERDQLPDDRPDLLREIDADHQNVIKQAETLLALQRVPPGVVRTEALRNEIADRLKAGLAPGDRGWSYFLDEQETVETLPTAFAVAALAAHGENVQRFVDGLVVELKRTSAEPEADIFVECCALYQLCFLARHRPERRDLRKIFNRLWEGGLSRLLDNPQEANVEYLRRSAGGSAAFAGSHKYVRVPWQIYLIAAASYVSPIKFTLWRVQKLLRHVIQRSAVAGFFYPHSGTRLSTRTHAILVEAFDRMVTSEIAGTRRAASLTILDRARGFLHRWYVRWPVSLAATAFLAWSTWQWSRTIEGGLPSAAATLAPEFVATLMILLVSVGKSDE